MTPINFWDKPANPGQNKVRCNFFKQKKYRLKFGEGGQVFYLHGIQKLDT